MKIKFPFFVVCLFTSILTLAQNTDTLLIKLSDTSLWVDNYWYKKNTKIPISIEVVQRKSMYLGTDTVVNGKRKLLIRGIILTTLQDRFVQKYLKCCFEKMTEFYKNEMSRNNMYYRDNLIDSLNIQSTDSIVYQSSKLLSIYKKYHLNVVLLFLGVNNITISDVIIKNRKTHFIILEKELPVYYLIKYSR